MRCGIISSARRRSSGASDLLGMQILTSGTGTYIPTLGTKSIVIELVGGGGGGSGATTNGGNASCGPGAGGGGYVRKRLTANFSGSTYSVGAGGAGGAAGNNLGSDGSDTTFTDTQGTPVTYTAGKGLKGGVCIESTGTSDTIAPGAGGTATNGDINIPGQMGGRGHVQSANVALSGSGGNSVLGAGGGELSVAAGAASAGNNGQGYGGGGSAAIAVATPTGSGAGGSGANGVIIIWEYV